MLLTLRFFVHRDELWSWQFGVVGSMGFSLSLLNTSRFVAALLLADFDFTPAKARATQAAPQPTLRRSRAVLLNFSRSSILG